MSRSPLRETAGSPSKSVESSDSSSIDDRFLTAPQTPEESVSGDMVARQHSSSTLDSYVSVDEQLDDVTLTLPQLSLPTNKSEGRVTETVVDKIAESLLYTSGRPSSSKEATQTIPIPSIEVHDQDSGQPRIDELRVFEKPEGLLSDVRMEVEAQDLRERNATTLDIEENMAFQRGKEHRPKTPKAPMSPLPEEPEDLLDQLRMFPNPDLPEGHPYHGMKANDPVIYTDDHPYGIPMEIPQQNIEHIQYDSKVRPLNAQQKALAGIDQNSNPGSASDVNPDPYMQPLRRLGRVNQSQGSRRSHAIPIVSPTSRTSTRPYDPSRLNPYAHGVPGVPSHYIPLYGVCHGMFFDPVTNLYIGDGPPRSIPERSDGTYPCTMGKIEAEPQPKNPTGDSMHIQSKAFIDNAIASSKERLATPAPHPATYPADPNSQTAPGAAFKLYFCRCTGKWLEEPHKCTEGPMKDAQIPEKAGYAPWEPLPEGWIKNRIMVDQSIYPGGKIPATPGLPTNWFKEMPVYDLVTNQRLGLGPDFAVTTAGSSSSGYTLRGRIPPEIGPAPPTGFPAQGPPTTPPPKSKAKAPEPGSSRVIKAADYEPASDSDSESSSDDDTLEPSPTATVTADAEVGGGSSSGAMAGTHGAKASKKKGRAGKRKPTRRGDKGGKKW